MRPLQKSQDILDSPTQLSKILSFWILTNLANRKSETVSYEVLTYNALKAT